MKRFFELKIPERRKVTYFILFFVLLFQYTPGFSQCTLEVSQTPVSCNGGIDGSASVSVTGSGAPDNCAAPDSPNEDCNSGIQVTNNDNDIIAGSGQKYVINFSAFNRKITLNGGTVLICGTASPSSVEIWSGGTLIVTGTATFSNFTLCSTCTLNNYGTVTFNGNTSIGGTFTNNGTVHFYSGGTTVSNWSGSTMLNKGVMEIHSASLENNSVFTNSGILKIDQNLSNNGSSFTNNCTIEIGQDLNFNSSNYAFINNGKITVTGTTSINSSTRTDPGSEIITSNLNIHGSLLGAGSTCSSIKVSNRTEVYTSNITGLIAICDSYNGIEINYSQGIEDRFNCNCDVNTPVCSYSWSNGATTSSINNLSAGSYTVTVNCSGCSTLVKTIDITEPDVLTAIANVNGDDAAIIVSGGTTPYSYSWSNGGSGASQNNLDPGTYTVNITDDNGCQFSLNVIIESEQVESLGYAVLQKKLDAGYHHTKDGKLLFKYFEEYADGTITYRILDRQRVVKVSNATFPLPNKKYGNNFYDFDVTACGFSLVDGEFYILEVTNDKKEVYMLRFKYIKPSTAPSCN